MKGDGPAEAKARSRGRTAAVWQIDFYNEERKLLALVTTEFRLLS
jgi:acyl-coenzyme A thioesterase PaaI-like protein